MTASAEPLESGDPPPVDCGVRTMGVVDLDESEAMIEVEIYRGEGGKR